MSVISKNNSQDLLEATASFFPQEMWAKYADIEKKRFSNQYSNYLKMIELGLDPVAPDFVRMARSSSRMSHAGPSFSRRQDEEPKTQQARAGRPRDKTHSKVSRNQGHTRSCAAVKMGKDPLSRYRPRQSLSWQRETFTGPLSESQSSITNLWSMAVLAPEKKYKVQIVYRQTPEERDDNRSQETETSSGSSVTFDGKKTVPSGDQHSKEHQDMSFTASQNETGENPGYDGQPSHQGGTKHTSARECGVLTEVNRRDVGRVKGGEQNNQKGDKRTRVLEKNNPVRDSQGGVRKNGVGPEEDKENLGVQEECTIHTARKENKDVALTREKEKNRNVPKKEEYNKIPHPEDQDTTKSIHCTQNSAEINSEDKNLLSCGEDIVGEIKQDNDSEHQIRKDNHSEHLSSKEEDGEYSSRNEEDDVKGREEGRKTHRVRFEMDNKDKVPEKIEAIVKGWRIFDDESAGDLEAGQKTSSPVKPRRYSLRRSTRKSYAEIPLPADDDFIFCDDCDREWEGECLFHSLTLIFDRQVARDGSVPDRARQTVPWPLSINPSKVPGAGLGVWTNADLPPRLVFGPYEGRLLQETQSPGTESGYGWRIRGHSGISCVDAEDPSVSNWMRYVNCSRNLRETNLAAFQYQGQIYYRTVTHINMLARLLFIRETA